MKFNDVSALTLAPADRIISQRVISYVECLEGLGNSTQTVLSRLQELGEAAKVFDPDRDWTFINRLASKVRARHKPARSKTHLRLSDELIELGTSLIARARNEDGLEAAILHRDGLLIALTAYAPSAIFTAVVRPTLPHAPAFHVRAPIFGSGKTYLCELIGSFAGPGGNQKVSYPMTSEEATKVILSLLLTSPAVVEFDDMDTDWIPHGTIKRMLTAENITDRILGVSKTATVSTRSLFLGSGNNVGPIRDLLRRVLTIHVDPRCPTPATNVYAGRPVEKVRRRRGDYVSAVLTIIEAWKVAGKPVGDAKNIVTYDGAWSQHCRYPLMWLGHPDPATSLFEQISRDPDGDILGALMQEWYLEFGSSPTTVRRVVDRTHTSPNLLDAIREFPVEERGEINRSKLGWILKKNANRIVNGFEFQQSEADGSVAWRVVRV